MSEEEKVGSVIDPKRELTAMQKIAEALQGLDEVAIARILRWATELHGVQAGTAAVRPPVSTLETRIAELPQQHGELADFYAACDPETDAEKALVVAYWLQLREGAQDFDAQRVNNELKHLGYQIGNITRAFDNLESMQPKLVIQIRKLGNTKQARKRLRLTIEGKKAVEQMLPRSAF